MVLLTISNPAASPLKKAKHPLWGWIGGALVILLLNGIFIGVFWLLAHPINVMSAGGGANRKILRIAEEVGMCQILYLLPLAFLSRNKKNFVKGLFLGAFITVLGNLLYLGHSVGFW